MCLVAIAREVHPDYPLIVIANRDEFYIRNTARADWWAGNAEIVGGKDLQAGGTWMAAHKDGRWGCVTNYRDLSHPQNPHAPSRGDLIPAYLQGKKDPFSFLEEVHANDAGYNGYNLLVGQGEEIWHYSNQEKRINPVASGVNGLSNHLLNTPWPKVVRLTEGLRALVSSSTPLSIDALFALLQDRNQAADEDLPATGVPLNWERTLSAMFIETPDGKYGTRVSTLLMRDKEGKVHFEERAFVPRGEARIFEYPTR